MLTKSYAISFYVSILLYCLPQAHATEPLASVQELQQEARDLHLADTPIWQKLILFKQHAEITSPNFYFSDLTAAHLKQITPQQELDATIEALHDDPRLICQYPARYYWLSHQLRGMPSTALDGCKNLPSPQQDVRLLLVSGYLKNPVSTFGHVLITIGGQDERQNLLDSAYNYGAQIPNHESSMNYIVKGLFGFYHARFANSQYFKQDVVYAKTEQRDIWAYTLNLTAEQKALLIYHLAEIQFHSIDYYFIKQNCAYRSGELLELIADIQITNRVTPWYAPEYIFDQMEEYRHLHPDFIKRVEYLPSDQNQLYFAFSRMPKQYQDEINDYIKTGELHHIKQLDIPDQEKILEFLIAYLNLKQIEKNIKEYDTQKKQLVRMRIQLPIGEDEQEMMPSRASPALGEKPSKLALVLGNDQGYLNFTVFNKDMLSANSNLHDEFKILDFSWRYQQQEVKLQTADFIHILKIEDLNQKLAGEKKLSWELAVGAKPDIYTGELHRPYTRGSLGVGYDFAPHLVGYSLLGAELNDSPDKLDAVSETALVYQQEPFAVTLSQTFQQRRDHALVHDTRFELRYRVAKNMDFKLQLSNRDNNLAYQYYW